MARPSTRWASCARSVGRSSPPTMGAPSSIVSPHSVATHCAGGSRASTKFSDGTPKKPFAPHDNLTLVGTAHRRRHHLALTKPSPIPWKRPEATAPHPRDRDDSITVRPQYLAPKANKPRKMDEGSYFWKRTAAHRSRGVRGSTKVKLGQPGGYRFCGSFDTSRTQPSDASKRREDQGRDGHPKESPFPSL